MLWPSNPNLFLINQLFDIMPKCESRKHIISGFPEYAVTPDKLGDDQRAVLLRIAQEIVASSKTNSPIVAVLVVGHADVALREPVQKRAAFEQQISQQRADEAVKMVVAEVRRQGGEEAAKGFQTRATGVGSTQRLTMNPVNESQMRLNRRVEVFLAKCLLPTPNTDDTFEKRITRALKLLETKRVNPDTTGTRTTRARCILNKMLNPKVVDVFVDGGASNETIGGRFIGEKLVGWQGNYDPPPLSDVDFRKFLATVSPVLKGEGFAPTQSDDHILTILGQLVLRIDEGMNLVNVYVTRQNAGDKYIGDKARIRLQNMWIQHRDDENNIYSCYR